MRKYLYIFKDSKIDDFFVIPNKKYLQKYELTDFFNAIAGYTNLNVIALKQ